MGARKAWWAATAVVVAMIAGVGVYLSIGSGDKPKGSGAAAFARRGMTIERELRSGNAWQLRDAITMPSGVEFDPAAASSLGALRSIMFDVSTFREVSPGTARVRALVTDSSGAQHAWAVALLMSGGEWKLAASTAAAS